MQSTTWTELKDRCCLTLTRICMSPPAIRLFDSSSLVYRGGIICRRNAIYTQKRGPSQVRITSTSARGISAHRPPQHTSPASYSAPSPPPPARHRPPPHPAPPSRRHPSPSIRASVDLLRRSTSRNPAPRPLSLDRDRDRDPDRDLSPDRRRRPSPRGSATLGP